MRSSTIFALAATLASGFVSVHASETREFHIGKGTGGSAWNTEAEIVVVRVGDVIRIHNDDIVNHELHTFGAPCEHGPNIAPGTSWDCAVTSAFDPKTSGTVYDHYYGPSAAFWVRATL